MSTSKQGDLPVFCNFHCPISAFFVYRGRIYPARQRDPCARRVERPAGVGCHSIVVSGFDQRCALTQTEGAGNLLSLSKMESADLIQTKGFGSSLCSRI